MIPGENIEALAAALRLSERLVEIGRAMEVTDLAPIAATKQDHADRELCVDWLQDPRWALPIYGEERARLEVLVEVFDPKHDEDRLDVLLRLFPQEVPCPN